MNIFSYFVLGAAIAKECGLLDGKTIYVTGSVCEEFCDGVNIKKAL